MLFPGAPHAVLACGSSFSVSRSPAGCPILPVLCEGWVGALYPTAHSHPHLSSRGSSCACLHADERRAGVSSGRCFCARWGGARDLLLLFRVPHTPFLRVGPRSLSPALLHAGGGCPIFRVLCERWVGPLLPRVRSHPHLSSRGSSCACLHVDERRAGVSSGRCFCARCGGARDLLLLFRVPHTPFLRVGLPSWSGNPM